MYRVDFVREGLKMREHKFRGTRVDNGEWIRDSRDILCRDDWDENKGWTKRVFLQDGYSCNETPKTENFVEVHPETVGEYIGRKDKNDIEIYEGDKTNCGIVEWLETRLMWVVKVNDGFMSIAGINGIEVISPELLEA